MSDDNKEKIVVEVDGTSAETGFDRIRSAAAAANAALNQTPAAVGNAQQALNNLLGVGGRTAAGLNQAGAAGNAAAAGITNAGAAAAVSTNHFLKFQSAVFGVKSTGAFIWDLAADGFRMAMGFANAFIDRASAVQRTMSLLSTIQGSDSHEEFEYLTRTANNYGLSLKAIQDDYAKLNLAAKNTALTQEDVRRVFEQVSMATRTLHMNAQQTQLTFLAIEQMLSKGKISMEELRKQFAERIPGAMNALAREMGVTMPVLTQLIEKVGASSEKIVPVLGNAIQRLYSGGIMNAAQALDAERNRIETSVAVFFKNVVEAGGTEGMSTLLRTINGLLQTETVAKVFADAMNKITTNIATFLSTLKPEDIERFAKTALDFLATFAQLAMAAGRAVIFLSQHLPEVGMAIGAFMGATAGAPFGPWGAAIGMVAGGIGGYKGMSAVSGSSSGPGDMTQMNAKYDSLQTDIAALETKIADSKKGVFGFWDTSGGVNQRRLIDLKKQRDELGPQLEAARTAATLAQSPFIFDTPDLDPLRDMRTGTDAQVLAQLRGEYGITNGKKSKEQLAAERLATRQSNAIQDLAAKVRGLRNPEEDAFDSVETNMAQMGIKSGHPDYITVQNLLVELQYYKNKKAQDASDKKTMGIEQQYTEMTTAADADTGKFKERFDVENLQQIDDKDWATKARKMGNELDAVLIEQKKKWDEFALKNPLFNFGFDREARLAEMRSIGDAYIEEFKRIEAEKTTIMGGTKSFLKDWNANAQDFGKITSNFLQGVTDNIVDMLTNMVMTGQFSFAKLTQFVLGYIAKMLIVQAITPFVNMFAGALSSGLGSLLNIGTSLTSQGTFGSFDGPRRATGGPVWAGEKFLVGEKGPEIVTFDRPGYVHPNESLSGSQVMNSTTIQINIDAGGKTSVSGDNGAAGLGRRIADAVRSVIIDEKRPGGMLSNG